MVSVDISRQSALEITPRQLPSDNMARSLLSTLAVSLAAFSFPQLAIGLGATDTITWGGDNSRAGYETNHNLDPRIIAGADFGNIWTAKLPGNFNGIGQEQVLSQPLVYTTGDGVQYVFVATTQNNVYKINAKTGQIVTSRNLGVPFLAADLGSELLDMPELWALFEQF
jgi:outer membrane protein assembly factor BamB